MPKHILVLKTYQRSVKGKTKLCGQITTKDGKVVHEALNKSTLRELSRTLRQGGYIPPSMEIVKKGTVEFTYSSSKPLQIKASS